MRGKSRSHSPTSIKLWRGGGTQLQWHLHDPLSSSSANSFPLSLEFFPRLPHVSASYFSIGLTTYLADGCQTSLTGGNWKDGSHCPPPPQCFVRIIHPRFRPPSLDGTSFPTASPPLSAFSNFTPLTAGRTNGEPPVTLTEMTLSSSRVYPSLVPLTGSSPSRLASDGDGRIFVCFDGHGEIQAWCDALERIPRGHWTSCRPALITQACLVLYFRSLGPGPSSRPLPPQSPLK